MATATTTASVGLLKSRRRCFSFSCSHLFHRAQRSALRGGAALATLNETKMWVFSGAKKFIYFLLGGNIVSSRNCQLKSGNGRKNATFLATSHTVVGESSLLVSSASFQQEQARAKFNFWTAASCSKRGRFMKYSGELWLKTTLARAFLAEFLSQLMIEGEVMTRFSPSESADVSLGAIIFVVVLFLKI